MSVSKLRIGKDITIKMSVLTNGEPVSLDGRDISVVLKTPMCQEVKLGFTTEDNVITTKYEGTKQKYCGVYSLTVWENYGKIGQSALDFCNAFVLVSNTCKEVPASEGLEIETVELEGDLSIGLQGASAYEVALNNGFEGTEEEWLESLKGKDFTYEDFTPEQIEELQKPAAEAAQAATEATNQAVTATENANNATQSATQASEEARQATSNAKQAAQTANATNESVTKAEEGRVLAESQRVSAESAREKAETDRASTFATLQGQIEEAVGNANSAVTTAEGVLQTAQQANSLAQGAVESANQATQEANQATANANAATESISTLEASIESAETKRVSAENSRVSAEAERESAEESRKQAESGRVTAEHGRASAESSRATAEQSRASAEQQRVTEFATLKQESETATTNANEAAENANQAASEVTDRLSETYPNLDAIKASGETNPNKIYIDAEKQTSYIYLNGEYVSVGGDTEGEWKMIYSGCPLYDVARTLTIADIDYENSIITFNEDISDIALNTRFVLVYIIDSANPRVCPSGITEGIIIKEILDSNRAKVYTDRNHSYIPIANNYPSNLNFNKFYFSELIEIKIKIPSNYKYDYDIKIVIDAFSYNYIFYSPFFGGGLNSTGARMTFPHGLVHLESLLIRQANNKSTAYYTANCVDMNVANNVSDYRPFMNGCVNRSNKEASGIIINDFDSSANIRIYVKLSNYMLNETDNN